MKVAIVNQPIDQIIPPNQNSIGLWTFHAAPQIAKLCEGVIVYGKCQSQQKVWDSHENVEYRFIPPLVPNKTIFDGMDQVYRRFGRNELPIYGSRLYYLDYIIRVAWNLRQSNVDVVHIHNFTQFVPIVRVINPNVKIALHMNCEWLNQLDYEVMKQRIAQCDLVLGSSDYITGKVMERYPEFESRCHTLYNGVDVGLFHNLGWEQSDSGCGQRLLFVGRVSPEKGVHVLIEAFARIVEKFPEATLDLAGAIMSLPYEYIVGVSEDPEVAGLARFYQEDYGIILQRMVDNHGLTGKVNFLGMLSQEELVKYYQQADILVNPSYSESFGMSLIEAMASETPVVASRVGGMVDIVDEMETGLLVERGDVVGLSEALLCLLEAEALRLQMGKTGRLRVMERFSWPRIAKSALEKYQLSSGV